MCAFHLFEYGSFFHFLLLFFGLKSVDDKINKSKSNIQDHFARMR